MKNALIALLFILCFYKIAASQTGWYVKPSFTSENLYDCKLTGYQNMHIASDNGKIYKSTNGGVNWIPHNFNDPLLSNSSFKYILGQSNDNFTAVGEGAGLGFLYAPIDSVMRITSQPWPTLEAYSVLGGVFFYSAQIAAGDGGKFYKNEGSGWGLFSEPTNLANGRKINYSWGDLFVGDNGLIIKADSIGYMLSGGRRMRWRVIPSGTTKHLNAIIGGNGSPRYVAVGDDGTILKSDNYGETWINVSGVTNENLYGVWLNYASVICGANGTILRSYTQSNDKWYKQISPTTEDLYFIYTMGYWEYIAGGRNGIYIQTTDGGGSLKRFIGTHLLQGFYNSATNAMVSDTIRVTVRAAASPYNVIDSQKDILSTSGYGMVTLGPTVLNNVPYWIQINHRNSIETWSKTTQTFVNNDCYYDFCLSANKAYGDNMKQVDASPVRFAFYGGDANQDGSVDVTDIIEVYNDAANIATGYVRTDMTGDDVVDVSDVILTYNNATNVVTMISP